MKVICFYYGEELTAEELERAKLEQQQEVEWGVNLVRATYEMNHGYRTE